MKLLLIAFVPELIVQPLVGKELVMGALFADNSAVQDKNVVDTLHGDQSVLYKDGGLRSTETFQVRSQFCLGPVIEV